MLIQFSASNFRSFFDEKILSLEATSITEFKENVAETPKGKLNKCAVLYGANASGKSNFLRAMGLMKNLVFRSFDQSSSSPLPFDPFLLKINSSKEPTSFEVVFLIKDYKYRYGLEFDNKSIRAEWLFVTEKRKEKVLFIREGNGIEVFPAFKEGFNLEEKTRSNALFLNVVDQFNGPISRLVMQWFNNFNVIDGISHTGYRGVTFKMLEDAKINQQLNEFFKELDLGFDHLEIEKEIFDPDTITQGLPEDLVKQVVADLEGQTIVNLTSKHKIFDDEGNFTNSFRDFNVRRQESSGTNKIIDLSGPIFDTLKGGGILAVDELDAKLHPLLTIAIVKLFQNQETNPKNAQLIFATHNTTALGLGRLRRDQIYFTEKDELGVSDLYSLVEYSFKGKKVRKDNSFERDYIRGRYGAIPFIGDLQKLNIEWQEK